MGEYHHGQSSLESVQSPNGCRSLRWATECASAYSSDRKALRQCVQSWGEGTPQPGHLWWVMFSVSRLPFQMPSKIDAPSPE
eukprot:scaffold217751_cov28-Attheya_sp.AAC.1